MMFFNVIFVVSIFISGGHGSPFVSSNNYDPKRYDDFATTAASHIVAGGSSQFNRFTPNYRPVNLWQSRPYIKPAINSEPALLPDLPTGNGIEPHPQAVPMTFLPVFPWPSNMPSHNEIFSMFPRSGSNEFWPRPRVDDRMSHFPMPGHPLPGSVNTASRAQRQEYLTTVTSKPVTMASWETVQTTTPTTTTTTTTTTTMTTTTATRAPSTTTLSEAESNHIWDSTELLKQPTFPDSQPGLMFRNSVENSVERETETTTTTTTRRPTTTRTTTTRRPIPRRPKTARSAATLSTKYDFLNNRKTKSLCRPLNPLTDSITHPDSDRSCDPNMSKWRKSPSCRCRYLVATRNVVGCPVRYHTICWRI